MELLKKHTTSLLILLIIELLCLILLLSCKGYIGFYHFSRSTLQLHTDNLIHNDTTVPLFIIHVFHNKIILSALQIFDRYIAYFDLMYLIRIVGLLGIVGLMYYCYKVITQRKRSFYLVGLILLLFPFVEIFFSDFPIPFVIKILYLIIPYQVASGIGYFQLLEKLPKRISLIFTFLLFILSIGWILVILPIMQTFCYR